MYLNLGIIYDSKNDEKALLCFKEAAKIDSLSDLPYINIGNYYIKNNDSLKAIENWERAFNIAPKNIDLCEKLIDYFKESGDSIKSRYYSGLLKDQQ